jgi:hypothetical protein
MYYLIAIGTTVVLPLVSIVVEYISRPELGIIFLMGKWFVFWGIGVRLLFAGLMQATRPSFTASTILGVKDPDAGKIVVELGYANIAMGLLGVLSLIISSAWIVPAGLAGGLFLGMAGLKHVTNAQRNTKENVALATDLIVFVMVAIYLISLIA